jgi:hypothetical protein
MNKSYDHAPGKYLPDRVSHPHENDGGKPSTPNGRVESSDNSMLVKLNDDDDDDDAIVNPSEINGNVLETSCCRNHGGHCSCLSPSIRHSPTNCDVCDMETPEKHLNNLRQPCRGSLGDERCSSPDPTSSFLHNSPVLTGNCNKRKLSRVCSAPCLTRSWSPDETGELSA